MMTDEKQQSDFWVQHDSCHLQMYGFMVTDDTGKTKKLWSHSQQACQDWCNFLSQWAQKQVLLTHWYHIQWNKLLGR